MVVYLMAIAFCDLIFESNAAERLGGFALACTIPAPMSMHCQISAVAGIFGWLVTLGTKAVCAASSTTCFYAQYACVAGHELIVLIMQSQLRVV